MPSATSNKRLFLFPPPDAKWPDDFGSLVRFVRTQCNAHTHEERRGEENALLKVAPREKTTCEMFRPPPSFPFAKSGVRPSSPPPFSSSPRCAKLSKMQRGSLLGSGRLFLLLRLCLEPAAGQVCKKQIEEEEERGRERERESNRCCFGRDGDGAISVAVVGNKKASIPSRGVTTDIKSR